MSTTPSGPITPSSPPTHRQLSWEEFAAEEPLSDVTFVVVDLETTGGPATQAGITEIGAVKVRGGEVLGEFATLVEPGVGIPAHIQSLTGITPTMVRDAPSVAGAVAAFGEFARDAVLVAHNAPYDLGFLKAACVKHDLTWFPGRSLDTARLARVALHSGEVRNCKLATLAQHFGSPITPVHRALADAQATTHVLHRLLERVGCFGVHTWTDLRAFVSRVSKEQRAKRHLADGLPTGPGVYTFVDQQGVALYIGMSRNVRARVRNYFTSAEQRARMTEMIHIAQRVDAIPCATALEANVRELRAIAEQQPRYNRKSRRASTSWWLQMSNEAAPRLVTTRVTADQFPDAAWGPFPSRGVARAAAELLCDYTGLRTCTSRIARNPSAESPQCLRGHLGSCAAPCSRTGDRSRYEESAAQVTAILEGHLQAFIVRARQRMTSYAQTEQFEEAALLRDQTASVIAASERFHRLRALRDAGRVIAASPDGGGGWDIHVIDDGRLVAATHARSSDDPRAFARAAAATAEVRDAGPSTTTIEEMTLLARWLESPGVRLVSVDAALSWPATAGSRAFVASQEVSAGSMASPPGRYQARRPVGPAPGVSLVSRLTPGGPG
jgi:DNA polymerase-3 subunit epsilon